jgi:hypothetical protein
MILDLCVWRSVCHLFAHLDVMEEKCRSSGAASSMIGKEAKTHAARTSAAVSNA